MYSALFYLCLILVIILLYNPDFIPNNFWKSKAFYNSVTKEYTTAKKGKRRLICFTLGIVLLFPLYFLQMNENYLEEEYFIEEQNRLEQEELDKINLEKVRQEKINTLEGLGVSNAFSLSEQQQDVLLDSVENKNCREKWLKILADDFGVHNPNLRKRTDNYNINKDCDLAVGLYTELELKQWEKERKAKAVTIRTLVNDYKTLGVLGGNQKYAKSNFDLKNCQILQISDFSSWTGYTIHLAAGTSNSVNCAMDYGKTEGAEILGKLRVGSRINLNAKVYGPQVDVYSYGSVTIRLEDGTIW